MDKTVMERMIKALYFDQAEHYFSESKEQAQRIDHMAPVYAANAATKLLREASFWASEAGATTRHPELWMTTTKLFQALVWRAGI